MPWLAAAAAVAGSLIGAEQSRQARSDADEQRKNALMQFQGVQAPEVKDQELLLQQYINSGVMSPELEALIQMGPTAMEGISLDPQTRAMQMQALEQMSGLASGQIQPGDMAAFELARRDAAAYDQAKQGQILQEMQQRGQGGSGAELLARLKSAQSSADRLNEAGLEQAKAMQQARMQALQQQANMASGIRTQDYSQESDLARARDAIAQFNAQNAQNVNARNTGARNQAQQLNLQNTQNIANLNTELTNKQQIHNKGLLQDQFNNQLNIARAKAGQYDKSAEDLKQKGADQAGMWGGIGQGVGSIVSAFGSK